MAELQEVYSLLVPLQGGRMIVPRTAVIEVMGWSKPKERPADAPAWLLGLLEWQGAKIPLISFEAACGQEAPIAKNRTRIAVLQAIGGVLEPPAFALATQGYPYLLRVNANVLRQDDSGEALAGPVLTRVRMANERPMIPDLEQLEQMLAKALGIEVRQPEVEAAEDADFDLDTLAGDDVIIDDDGVALGELEDTVPDPSAPASEAPPGSLTGLDDTVPGPEPEPESVAQGADESIDLSGGLDVGETETAGEMPAADEYEISIDGLELDDDESK
jgi:chemosensory pili system protein ChpC